MLRSVLQQQSGFLRAVSTIHRDEEQAPFCTLVAKHQLSNILDLETCSRNMRGLCCGWTSSAGCSRRFHYAAMNLGEFELLIPASLSSPVAEHNHPLGLKIQFSVLKMKGSPKVTKSCGEEESNQAKNGITQEALAVVFIRHHQELTYCAKELI